MKLLIKIFIFNLVLTPTLILAKDDQTVAGFFKDKWKLTKTSLDYLNNGEILAESSVSSADKNQSFDLKAAAVHPKNCTKVLRKLSMLENYDEWISFIKKSDYSDERSLATIKADHVLLPYPMIVHILVKRPTKPGVYPFSFPTGIFKGLSGTFTIDERQGKCMVFSKSHWSGKKQIPDFVVSIFAETLTKLAGKILFRKI
jgi:hypothetical protein